MTIEAELLRRWLAVPLWISISVSGVMMPMGVFAQGSELDSPSGPNSAIEEIVVSARKRAEFLEDTPIAVTALSAEQLRQADVTRFNEIRQFAPNLQIQTTPVGNDSASQFRLRGIGTTRAGTSFDPGVGVYIDGVFIPAGVSSVMNLVDVQQVEVLRGHREHCSAKIRLVVPSASLPPSLPMSLRVLCWCVRATSTSSTRAQ